MTAGPNLPHDRFAYREYEAQLADGTPASIAFTLGDADGARQNARAYGLISVLARGQTSARDPLMWVEAGDTIALVPADGAAPVSDDVHRLILRFMPVFLREVAPLAPQLAGLTPDATSRQAGRTPH
jgi:hypothetical protein